MSELVENLDSLRIPVKGSERRAGAFPYYGASGIVDWVDGYIFEGEHLLVAEDGENLNSRNVPVAFRATGKFWVNNHAHILKGPSHLLRFLEHYLNTIDIAGWVTGSAQPKLTQGNLNVIPVSIPSDDQELRAIARVLAALDDKIEANRRMNRILEEMAAALFRTWFVDFDPVVRNAEKKTGAQNVPSLGKSHRAPIQALDKLFPDAFQESGIGPIPEWWRWGIIGEFARLLRDGINPGATPMESFDHFSIPAFDGGKTPITELGGAIKSNKFIVAPGCVMVSKLNPDTPRIWLPELSPERKAICSTEFIVVMPQGDATREFLYGLFSSADFTAMFATYVTGTSNSHQRVQPDMLTAMDVAIPPTALIERFSQIVHPWLRQIAHNVRESQTLAALRDTLLPKLLSGEVRVRDARSGAQKRT